jgi:TRAP-type uncharacterized transport system substrate-binding protein
MFFLRLAIVLFAINIYAKDIGSIATSTHNSIYYSIGQDISALLNSKGHKLNVLSTNGSLNNLDILGDLTKIKNTDFAIVKYDLLVLQNIRLSKQDKSIFDKFKIVKPLHKEYINLLTYKGNKIDFNSKKPIYVACGKRGSGSCVTAKLLSQVSKKRFILSYMDFDKSIKYLKKKKIDLVIKVVGSYADIFKNLKGVELISLPRYKTLRYIYKEEYLTQNNCDIKYNCDLFSRPIKTYSIGSVLITKSTTDDDKVKIVANALKNKKYLIKNGHNIWQDMSSNKSKYPRVQYHKSLY